MKSEYSTQRSAKAAIKLAIKEAEATIVTLQKIKTHAHPEQYMESLRSHTATLTQRVHEFNAYLNVLKGDDASVKVPTENRVARCAEHLRPFVQAVKNIDSKDYDNPTKR